MGQITSRKNLRKRTSKLTQQISTVRVLQAAFVIEAAYIYVHKLYLVNKLSVTCPDTIQYETVNIQFPALQTGRPSDTTSRLGL